MPQDIYDDCREQYFIKKPFTYKFLKNQKNIFLFLFFNCFKFRALSYDSVCTSYHTSANNHLSTFHFLIK